MFVTIQVQSTRKPYPWVDTFRAKVLYADRKIIFARTAGGHSEFLPGSGRRTFGSYLTKPPKPQPKTPEPEPERASAWERLNDEP